LSIRLKLAILLFLSQSALSQTKTIIQTSSLQFPFKLSIKKIEETTNQAIRGIIYKDSLYTDDENDQLKCTVWKDGDIRLSSVKNNVLKVDVPLKVWIEKGVGAMGLYTYKNTEFRLIMSFHLVYNITKDWKLTTKTFKNGYIWTQKPSLNFVSLQVPITPIVEKILDSKQGEYANLIDGQIAKNINLKSQIIDVWNIMKEPQKVSEDYNTWLAIIPQNIETQPFTQDATNIKSALKININVVSSVGFDSSLKTPIVKDIPPLNYKLFNYDSFSLFTLVTIPYDEATKMGKQKFLNQEFSFNEGKYKVTVIDIILYSNNNKLVIETDLSGSFNGKVFIQGDIYYDEVKRVVKMKNLEFDMKTKNILHKAAIWLFNGKIERNLEENFEMPVSELLEYSLTSTNQALNRTQNGFKMSGKVWQLTPLSIVCNEKNMLLTLLAKGSLAVEK
jgi:hypothetical protein